MQQKSATRQQRAAQRRSEIVSAARELFLSQAYSQVNVEQIAAAAGLSRVAIYGYFPSKQEIYFAILCADADQLVEGFRAAYRPERGLDANLTRLAAAYVKFLSSHPEYFRRFSWFYLPGREQRLSPRHGRTIGRRFAAARGIIEDCLSNAVARGEIPAQDCGLAAAAIYAQWLGLAYLRVASDSASGRIPMDHRRISACAMQLLRGGLRTPGGGARPAGSRTRRRAATM